MKKSTSLYKARCKVSYIIHLSVGINLALDAIPNLKKAVVWAAEGSSPYRST
jgi:hypothetical protein